MTDAAPGTPRLAVLGSPIAHSKSPALHRAAYAALGLDWTYTADEVDSGTLGAYLDALGPEWRGLSLTMPLKQTVRGRLDAADRLAELTGAANTVLIGSDASGRRTLSGFNTDVPGIVRALEASGVTGTRHVHLLGGGATAASALVAAAELGAESVLVSVREPDRAAALRPLAASVGLTLEIRAFAAPRDDAATQLVISTLPGGVDTGLAFADGFRAAVPLFDVAYDPWPTTLAAQWLAAGGSVLSGLAMLVQQALLQVRVFALGDPLAPLPDEAAVLAAMLAAVGLGADGRPTAP